MGKPNQTNDSQSKMLSVIVPFRDNPELVYYMERLEDLCKEAPQHDLIEFIVVDSGSCVKSRAKCSKICAKNNIRYLYHDTFGEVFSIGDARDFGVMHAIGQAVTFFDIDFRVATDFWERLLSFMIAFGISQDKKSFFAVPGLYLTEEGTEEFINYDRQSRFLNFYLRWLYGGGGVQNLSPCLSIIIVDRLHYMSLGGHRSEFRGHGFEDFELLHRLEGENNKFLRPINYYEDKGSWDNSTYNGFRALFSLFGRPALMANLFAVHLWHPRPKSNNFYAASHMQNNRKIWVDFFKDYDKFGFNPEPLVDGKKQCKRILFFGAQRTNISRILKDAFPLLGQRIYISEYSLSIDGKIEDNVILDFISHNKIDMMIFANPYGNPVRLQIYEWCRKTKFSYIVYERGALPNSWFFDNRGFNADSESYNRNFWDRRLSKNEYDETKAYIKEVLNGDLTLEKQGMRIGAEALSQKLKTGNKKVLFVPLQRPSDTVIKYFSDDSGGMQSFIEAIDDTAQKMMRWGWVVICKKHPLETECPKLEYALYAPEDTHFIDLLELSSAVALINSGVGIYAMMMGKPCYIFGKAFYQFDGINTKINNSDSNQLCEYLKLDTKVNMEDVYKFIHYLLKEFYSFAVPKIISRQESDGSLRTITTALDFYAISLPNEKKVLYSYPYDLKISKNAPIFERFKLDLYQQNERKVLKEKQAGNKIIVKNSVGNANAITNKGQSLPIKVEKLLPNANEHIKQTLWFNIYSKFYGVFLSKKQKERLLSDPSDFFIKAKHPLSKLGYLLAKKYFNRK